MSIFVNRKKEDMPLKLTDLVKKVQNLPTEVVEDVKEEKKVDELPQYLFTDPEVVHYSDVESQIAFYNRALNGIVLEDGTSFLDLGCGRGDLWSEIQKINPKVNYTGVDFNENLIKVANQKYPDATFINQNILNFNPEKKYDWCLNILNTIINYGNFDKDDKYEFLSKVIRKSMSLCNIGSVFILLSDNSGIEGYEYFDVSSVISLIEKDFLFGVDQTENMNFYKVILLN